MSYCNTILDRRMQVFERYSKSSSNALNPAVTVHMQNQTQHAGLLGGLDVMNSGSVGHGVLAQRGAGPEKAQFSFSCDVWKWSSKTSL